MGWEEVVGWRRVGILIMKDRKRERDRENREKDIFLLVSLQEGRPV